MVWSLIWHLIHNSAPCDPHTRFPVACTKKLWSCATLWEDSWLKLNSVPLVIFFLKICRFCWTNVFKISWPFVTGQKVSTQYTLDKSCLTLTFHYKLSFFQNPLTPTLTPGHSYPREGQNISSVKKGKKGLTTHPSSFFFMYMSLYFSKIYMYNYIFLYASTYPSPQAGDVVASQLQAQHCRWEGPRTSRRSGGWETNGDGWENNSGGTAIPRLVYLFTVVLLLFLFSDVLKLLVFRAATCSRCKRIWICANA